MQAKPMHIAHLGRAIRTAFLCICLFIVHPVSASTNTIFNSGAFIINMGITPQTYNNGLKPYGMVYDLITNYGIEISWVINDSKAKDGTDFTYSATAYKGGPFVIRAEDISSSVATRITYWQGQGVQGVYTTSSMTIPVYTVLSYFPVAMIDNTSGKESVIIGYYTDAGIGSAAYTTGNPSQLTACHDLWANPHGDPTWTTHSYLYNYVTVNKSFIWSECHAVSMLEGLSNPSSPFQQLNYLTTAGLKCYSSGNCGAISESHVQNSTSGYTYYYPTDPVMQFMSTMDGACANGSERWYIPVSTGQWRSTTKRFVTTSDGTSPGEGVLIASGPAYGDSNNGYVMYEAGHDLDGAGTTAEKVGAIRAYFNFLLTSGLAKQMLIVSYSLPSLLSEAQTYAVSATPSGGCTPYTYSWTSTLGGSFGNTTASSTVYTAPTLVSTTTGVIKCTVTDCCGRKKIISSLLTVYGHGLPVSLISFSAKQKNNTVLLDWTTASERNSDYFTIGRSSTAGSFTEIARVKASGNSTQKIFYSFTDSNPLDGPSFYTLSQTDYDGNTKMYSQVYLSVNLNATGVSIRAGPVPFNDFLNMTYTMPDSGAVDFILMDFTGQSSILQKAYALQGENTFTLTNLAGLRKGFYILVIRNQESIVQRLRTMKE